MPEPTLADINLAIAEWVGDDTGDRPEHDWIRKKDGQIDYFGMDYGFHNGPRCKRCDYSYCEHCEPGSSGPCVVDPKPYTSSLDLLVPVVERWCKGQVESGKAVCQHVHMNFKVHPAPGWVGTTLDCAVPEKKIVVGIDGGMDMAEALARALYAAMKETG